ncbi:MAG: hypothetical protein ACQETH_17505 [Candidatus Rifleibacteriota bacterium]
MKKLLILLILGLIYWALFLRYIPPEPLKISRETTYLTEVPTSKDGLLWIQALNKKYMIKPEDNALIEFVKICGLDSVSTNSAYIEEFCKDLQYPSPQTATPIFFADSLPIESNQEYPLKFTFGNEKFEAKAWKKEDYPELAKAISENTESFDLIARASNKSACIWPYTGQIPVFIEGPSRTFKPTYPLSLLLAKGLNHLEENDLKNAWKSFFTTTKASKTMLQSNHILLTLYGLFVYKDALDCITLLINHKVIESDLLNEIFTKLDHLTNLSKANKVFEFESRLMPLSTIITELQNKGNFSFVFKSKGQRFFDPSAHMDLNIICSRINQEADNFLKIFKIDDTVKRIAAIEDYNKKRRLESKVSLNSHQALIKYFKILFFTLSSNKSQELSNFAYDILQAVSFPNYSGYVDEILTIQEKSRILRLATLIKFQQRKTGKFPETIEELEVSDPTILKDSFSGKPFHFKFASETLVIYSIGRDLKDNDGKTSSNIQNSDISLVLRK